jgi:hypothetical protein
MSHGTGVPHGPWPLELPLRSPVRPKLASQVRGNAGAGVGLNHAAAESVLPTWTENGTVVWPGTFPRSADEATFVERDEATLRRRSPMDRLVTPDPGGVEAQRFAAVLREYRAKVARRERRFFIARTLLAAVIGAACGIGAALATPARAPNMELQRAPPPSKMLVRARESARHRSQFLPAAPDATAVARPALADSRLAYRAPAAPARGARARD